MFRLILMVGVEPYKATADIIVQTYTDKIPDRTAVHFMASYNMLHGHR